MRYVALLRGINVGGNNLIKMIALKEAFEKSGFKNVSTFIQSGNVIFESPETKSQNIVNKIEKNLSKTFNYESRVVVKSLEQLEKIIKAVPKEWKRQTDLRKYIAFIKEPVTASESSRDIEIKEGIDSVKLGPGVLYLSTLISGLTKSKLNKLAGTKVYQFMTIRNYNTAQKLLKLMGQT